MVWSLAGWCSACLKVEVEKDSSSHLRGISPPKGVLQQQEILRVRYTAAPKGSVLGRSPASSQKLGELL